MKLITLSSDFAVQSHGCGVMEPVAFGICPDAKVVHLVHDLPDFNIKTSARVVKNSNLVLSASMYVLLTLVLAQSAKG